MHLQTNVDIQRRLVVGGEVGDRAFRPVHTYQKKKIMFPGRQKQHSAMIVCSCWEVSLQK